MFPRLSTPWLVLAAAAALLCTAAMTVFKLSNNDVWLHVTTGSWVLEHGHVPDHDLFSFISSGRPYVAHEWLSGVVLALVHSLAGVNGLIVLKALCVAAVLALHFLSSRALAGRVSVFLPLVAVVLWIGGERFIERPHLSTFLLTAAYLAILLGVRERLVRPGWLWAILPLHVLWVNLHGGWVAGLALLAAFTLGEALRWGRARALGSAGDHAPETRRLLHLVALGAACVPATLVNPYGARGLLLPFELTGMRTFMERIYEWQPPYAPSFNDTTMFAFFLALVVVFVTAFHLAGAPRSASSGGVLPRSGLSRAVAAAPALVGLALLVLRLSRSGAMWRPDVLRLALYLLLGVFLFSTTLHWRTADLTLATVFALFYSLALRHNRAVADAALVLLPLTTGAITELLERRRLATPDARPARRTGRVSSATEVAASPGVGAPRQDWSSPAGVALGSAVLLAVAAFVLAFDYFYDFSGSRREKGLGIASGVPTAAIDFVAANRITGNAFVSYGLAAPLLHRTFPAVKVNMDSRNEVYGEEAYLEYERALRSGPELAAYLARHPVDFFLLDREDCSSALLRELQRDGAWALVHRDELSCVLLPNVARNEELIGRRATAQGKPRANLSFPGSPPDVPPR